MQQQSEITKLYKGVIEEVIRNVRNDFVNMGVDEQVLYDLQMLWEQKLMDYKVITPSEYFGTGIPLQPTGNNGTLLMNPHLVHGAINPHIHGGAVGGEVGLNVLANGAVAAGQAQGFNPYGVQDNYGYIRPNNRTTYYHPSQGYFEASSSIPPTAANLPTSNGITNLMNPQQQQQPQPQLQPQQTKNAQMSLKKQQQQLQQELLEQKHDNKQNPRRYDGTGDDIQRKGDEKNNSTSVNDPEDIIKLLYTNGEEEVIIEPSGGQQAQITTTQSIDDDEINSDLDDDDDEDDKDADAEGYDESGTMDENVVLCQYEKVNRTRNKWRCVFKSGIIHVNGQDYVFSKANGEFEW